MIDEIYIFDNIVDIKIQDKIKTYVYNKTILWEEISNITANTAAHQSYSFPAKVISTQIDKDIIKLIDIIIDTSLSKIDKKLLQKYRVKINKTTPHFVESKDEFRLLHIDKTEQHITIIYYINDSDGDTLIFNDKTKNHYIGKEFMTNENFLDFKNFELNKSVTPKKGRVVIFDGNLWHYGKYPTTGERNIININLVIEKHRNELI
jgi:hypothetical protein